MNTGSVPTYETDGDEDDVPDTPEPLPPYPPHGTVSQDPLRLNPACVCC